MRAYLRSWLKLVAVLNIVFYKSGQKGQSVVRGDQARRLETSRTAGPSWTYHVDDPTGVPPADLAIEVARNLKHVPHDCYSRRVPRLQPPSREVGRLFEDVVHVRHSRGIKM
jgi:hypothetical protein